MKFLPLIWAWLWRKPLRQTFAQRHYAGEQNA